jgi:hypothetical protein
MHAFSIKCLHFCTLMYAQYLCTLILLTNFKPTEQSTLFQHLRVFEVSMAYITHQDGDKKKRDMVQGVCAIGKRTRQTAST